MVMFFFFIIAIAEISMGLMVYELLDPEKGRKASRFIRWNWLDLEAKILNFKKDTEVIKRANKIVLKFCILSALVTFINGVLHVFFGMVDLKEILVVITVLAIFPIRSLYIWGNRS
jgi:hypothetical protein